MVAGTRYHPLPVAKRCGLPECWCTPPEPPRKDYGTREAEPGARLVPRGLDASPKPLTYQIGEKF